MLALLCVLSVRASLCFLVRGSGAMLAGGSRQTGSCAAALQSPTTPDPPVIESLWCKDLAAPDEELKVLKEDVSRLQTLSKVRRPWDRPGAGEG